MKKTRIAYWIFTILFAFMMFGSALPDIFLAQIAIEGMHDKLGYPLYFIPFIGIAKVLGVIAILIPGYPRIKEWAYAGLIFDLIGAAYSIAASGGTIGETLSMLLPIFFAVGSYMFYHRKLKLTSAHDRSDRSIVFEPTL